MVACNFGPAAPEETIVYGACRPGRNLAEPNAYVSEWVHEMQHNGIARVCCLLDSDLEDYADLLGQYESVFGTDRVCHAPVSDFQVIPDATLRDGIYPFLKEAEQTGEPVVVHCAAGMGRTGQVLVLWLASAHGYPLEKAIQTVRQMGRAPLQAASRDDFRRLVTLCK
jgi:protein-tyrosine phosphatase